MAKICFIIGFVFIFAGVVLHFVDTSFLGRLPGDLSIKREGFHFYFPLTTGLIISVVISLIYWFLRK